MWNDDVEISLCRPTEAMDGFFRNGEGDEVIFVHEGSGTLETIFGDAAVQAGRLRRRPARHDLPLRADEGAQRHLVFESPGLIEIPRRYRNEYGQLLEHAPYYHRDIHPPTELHTHRERGESLVKVRVRGGYQTYVLDYHPFDVVGWDGYVYPWTFSIHDFEPITGRIHMPPPSHQTFQGRNFVICSFCPRKLDFDPLAIPIPYHHSNLNSRGDDLLRRRQLLRRGRRIEVGSVTLHPSGIPHGPHPGLAEKSIGMTETHELAVMCDTFHPLRLTKLAKRPRRRQVLALVVRGPGAASARPTRIPRASRRTSEPDARRALLARLWDYAGVFPPAELPLDEALAEWRRIRASDDAWLVNCFVARAGQGVDAEPSRSSTGRRSVRATSSTARARRSSGAAARAFPPWRRSHSSSAAAATRVCGSRRRRGCITRCRQTVSTAS